MPELPEVEIMCRNLQRWILGAPVSIELLDSSLCKEGSLDSIQSSSFKHIYRRAKYIVLSTEEHHLVLHFRMTGKVVLDAPEQRRAARAVFQCGDKKVLFVDRRRLGEARIVDHRRLKDLFSHLGPDAWPSPKSAAWWKQEMGSLRGAVKPALLQQKRIAGIGNILASEVLFEAQISPFKTCSSLTQAEWAALAQKTPEVISEVIERDSADEIGFVQDGAENLFAVYGKEGEPCPKCGQVIKGAKQSGRFSFWCTKCQPCASSE